MGDTRHTLTLPNALDEITPTFLSAALSQNYPGTTVGIVDVADLHQGSASSLRLRLMGQRFAAAMDDLDTLSSFT